MLLLYMKGDLDTLATAKEEETAALKQDHAALLQKKDALLTEKEREICKLCVSTIGTNAFSYIVESSDLEPVIIRHTPKLEPIAE